MGKKTTKKKGRAGSKAVVIVESPAKAKTINKILGPKFVVKACFGHVRDLPHRAFGIDPDKDFEPTYQTIRGKGKILADLRSATRNASEVYLAPDPDREGEAIAWHLVQALKIPEEKARRVTFNEITKEGVLEAFAHPSKISMDRVNAQQARRFLDRIVGYKLSPLLWKKVGRGLSAGRVQSVAVRLIVEREREILAFKVEEYWTVTAKLAKETAETFAAELAQVDGKELALKNGEETRALVDELSKERYDILAVQQKERVEHAPPPFTTSLLQQQASIKLRYSASRTMRIAQGLYEGVALGDEGEVGLITYMRTDSFRVADEALAECREHIKTRFGAAYVPDAPILRAKRKGMQEAHEAIRPTSVERTPEKMKPFLTEDQFRLYRLIWNRFVASQMKPAVYHLTEAKIAAGRGLFLAKGREMKFDGFTALLGHKLKEGEQILPPLASGDALKLQELVPAQHFTEPPPRYSEASLVKALEKFGIGRPSTYAPILSTIQDRGYIRHESRRIFPTELGMLVTDKLIAHFDDILNTGFTAKMEQNLDQIEDGKTAWVDVLREFYAPFVGDLEKALAEMESHKDKEPEVRVLCEKCGSPMLEKWNRFGKFLACSKYPECKNAKSLAAPEASGEKCDKCGADMTVKSGRFGRFLACTKYPECKGTKPLQRGNRRLVVPKDFQENCEKCGSPMAVRYGRRGAFIACTGYPNCKNTQRVPKEWYEAAKPTEGGTDSTD